MDTSQPFVVLASPVSPLTWESETQLPGTLVETARIPLQFRGPVEITGFYPSVIAITETNLRVPTPQDIAVMIDINDQERITNRLENTTGAGSSRAFVTLASMSAAIANRLVRLQLKNASPDVGVTFRWRVPPVGGVAVYEDALIGLAFFCRYLEGAGR